MYAMDTMAAGAAIVSKSIGQAADAITGVQHAIANAEELARKYGYQIADNGNWLSGRRQGKCHARLAAAIFLR